MSDIKEKFTEVMQDFGGRIKNPLIATFILVWLYQHWTLVFRLFNTYENFSVEEKLFLAKIYITHYGFCGMIIHPLITSFGSLICYYLIGILAQLIKIGGRYLNSLIAKLDNPNFVPRTELKKEEAYSKTLKRELIKANDENKDLIEFKHNAQQEYGAINRKLQNAESNILSNSNFQRNFEEIMMYLLHRAKSVPETNIRPSELHDNYFKVINGSWIFYTNQMFDKNRGTSHNYKINDSKVSNLNNEHIGEIFDLKFDKQYRILEFVMMHHHPSKKDQYYMIEISPDEWLGFCNAQYCHIKRHD